LTLTATGATNYTWSPTTDLSSATGSVVVANPNSTTTYSIIGANGSCTSTATSTVDVANTPTLGVNSGSICSGNSLTLTATGATNYTWSPVTDLSSATGSVVVANPNSTTTYSIIGANGSCTSTATSNVNVITTPTLGVNSGSICLGNSLTLTANGATNYTWSPTTTLSSSTGSIVVANPNTTTVYSVIGANGSCTATANSTVNVTSNSTLTVNSGSICSGSSLTLTANGALNYTWSPTTNLSSSTGSVVVANPNTTTIYSVIGVNGNCTATANSTVNVISNPTLTVNSGSICLGSSLTLTAIGATNYTWSPTTNLSSSTGSVVVANPNSTTIYSVIGANGFCTATANSTVNVISNPTLTVNSGSICSGSSLTLNANGALNYTWSPTTNLSSSTGSIVVANPNSTTIYSIIGANGSCTATANSTVNVISNPTLTVNSGSICSGSSLTLTANGAANYTWSPTTNLSSSSGGVVFANPNTTTVYSVIGTNAFGCVSSTNTTLTVVSTPTISAIANPPSICAGQTSSLSVVGASNYTWSPASTISAVNSSSTIANPITTTIYTILGSTGNSTFLCTASNTVQVNVIPAPTITVSTQAIICEGQSTTIYAIGANTYTWSPTIGLTNPYAASSNLTPSGSGTFIYTVTAANNNCITTETVEVVVNPLPIINAGSDTTINIDNTLVLFGTGNTSVGFLSTDGTPLSCNYCYSLTVNPQNNTCYILEGINNFGCRTTDDICVTVTKDWDVFIPNAFTPNGDKYNEVFIPVGYGIAQINLTIFDRWGHQVFKSNEEIIGWDGKKKGQLCEQGVYIYQAEVISLSGVKLNKMGHVTLLTRVR
jgi:gliding motility-associated-like protein